MGRIKELVMEGRNADCIYSFYGYGHLRCSREGNTGEYCQYWKCEHFKKGEWR